MYFKTKFLQRKFKNKLHPKSQAPLNFVRQSTIRLLTYYHWEGNILEQHTNLIPYLPVIRLSQFGLSL